MISEYTFDGNVGQDPETKTFQDGNTSTTFSVGHSQGYFDTSHQWVDQGTMWIRVRPRGSQPESVVPHIHKGTKVVVSGKLVQKTFTRQDGSQGTSLEVIASAIGIVPPKDKSQPQPANQYPAQNAPQTQNTGAYTGETDPWGQPSAPFNGNGF